MKLRESARLVILNERNEIFLFHCREERQTELADPHLREFWLTPGGGVDPGETWEDAALRELWEETGIEGIPLGPWVWTREKAGLMFGEQMRAVERYYLVRVGEVRIDTGNQFDYERAAYRRHRWWSAGAIGASGEVFFPEGLAGHLARLVADGPPGQPVDISPR